MIGDTVCQIADAQILFDSRAPIVSQTEEITNGHVRRVGENRRHILSANDILIDNRLPMNCGDSVIGEHIIAQINLRAIQDNGLQLIAQEPVRADRRH